MRGDEVLGRRRPRASGPTTPRSPPRSTPRSRTTPGRSSWPTRSRRVSPRRRRATCRRPRTARRGGRLAAESGHTDTARLLASVVDVLDAKTGTVRLRAEANKAGTMALDSRAAVPCRSAGGADRARRSGRHLPAGARLRRPRLLRRVRPALPAARRADLRAGRRGLGSCVDLGAHAGPSPAARRCAVCGAELDGRFCERLRARLEATAVPVTAPGRPRRHHAGRAGRTPRGAGHVVGRRARGPGLVRRGPPRSRAPTSRR